MNLNWTASTDSGGSGLASYRVERCTGAGCSNFGEISAPTTNSFGDSGLSASTTYQYRVRARDGANNNSGYSNTASATTQSGIPGVPTLSTSHTTVIQPNQFTITWTAQSGATYYELYRSVNGGAFTLHYSGTATSRASGSLGAADYIYRVKACSGYGCSANSNERTVMVCGTGGCN